MQSGFLGTDAWYELLTCDRFKLQDCGCKLLLLRVLVLHVYLIEAEWKVIDTLLFLG